MICLCSMAEIDFVSQIHKKTKRDYLARVNEFPKAEAARIAGKFDKDYWDGDRKVGYGGRGVEGRGGPVSDPKGKELGQKTGPKILSFGLAQGSFVYGFCP